MKKKVVAMLLAFGMIFAFTGCSAYGQMIKMMADYVPETEDYTTEEEDVDALDDNYDESLLDEDDLWGEMEEDQYTEVADASTVTFENGESFELTESTIEGDTELGYKLAGTESILEVTVVEDYPATDLVGDLTDELKENSGETPIIDYHGEGTYLTGIYDDMLLLVFVREDGEGLTYVLTVYTVDTDNAIDIMNGIVTDFLESGIAGYDERTEYGNVVTDLDTTDLYYTVPEDYECTYSCEYFNCFENGQYEVTMNEDPDDELQRFFDGESKTYYEVYQLKEIATVDSSYGTIRIVEGEAEGIYKYFAASEDGTVAMEFTNNYSDAMDQDECVELVKSFIS